ncbi:MAG: non-ribosomal peptide synthetase [Candidatus Rokubacteria bacterium]|nr:non-ribosomal peptide synthetase [Candidatus Rokubacteria bacterium]
MEELSARTPSSAPGSAPGQPDGLTEDTVDLSIPRRFERQVTQYPDRIAVKSRRQALTYDGLNRAANRVARAILGHPASAGQSVALLLESDASMIAAMLGVLKAGKVYVPLDPLVPRARLTSILEDAQASLIVTNTQNLPLADALAQTARQAMNIDELDADLSSENLDRSISPDALTWILYTSGSTGQPKGVVQTHRNVLAFVKHYTDRFHFGPADRLTLLFSCGVNLGAHDIFGALLTGASLRVFDIKAQGLAHLAAWLIEERITVYTSVPTVFRHFVDTLTGAEEFHDLRLIKLGGEPVCRTDVELYKKHFSDRCIFVNRLGTTETGSVRWYIINKEGSISGHSVPVGYPVEDHEILLLDDAGRAVGVDEVGEIVVKSRYLSPGYWRRPELTRAAFLPDPDGGEARLYRTGDLGRMLADGCLMHLGRKDFQVKIRGHRVEVDEIEMALRDLAAIKEAVVVAREDRSGDHRLVAYLVPRGSPAPTITTLRRALAERLPDYMVPSAFVFLDALPLAPNGKVHRRALPAPGAARPALDTPFVGPRTPVEARLERICAEVLDLEQVGIHDSFLDLGGHSLLAARIVARVLDTFHVEIPLRSLLEAPTVAAIAVVIDCHLALGGDHADMDRVVAEVEGLSDDEARRLLAEGTS